MAAQKTADMSDTKVTKATVRVKVDLQELILDALDRRFPDSEVHGYRLNVEDTWDAMEMAGTGIDDFYVSVDVDLGPA